MSKHSVNVGRNRDGRSSYPAESSDASKDNSEALLYAIGILSIVTLILVARLSTSGKLRAEANLGLLALSVLALLLVLFAPEQTFNRIRQIKDAGGNWMSYNGLRVALDSLLFLLAVASIVFFVDYGKIVGKWFSIGAVSGITLFRMIGYYFVHYRAKWRERKLRKWAKMKSQRRQGTS